MVFCQSLDPNKLCNWNLVATCIQRKLKSGPVSPAKLETCILTYVKVKQHHSFPELSVPFLSVELEALSNFIIRNDSNGLSLEAVI
uniref:Uncharacterized protein n=1 Tax=Rhizophora mucronata TaxID=61149 RepID=A0A2P2NFW0_RHIMU